MRNKTLPYVNQTDDPAITSIYVMKSSLVKPYPETITVKIEMET